MKKLLFAALLLALVASGCAITDYPVITDTRGAYTGIIRTSHKAYIIPTSHVATNYEDGSDELFTLVSQNQYGDQHLFTFNNFDPTGLVNFLEDTYCDWRYTGCEAVFADNPANPALDVDTFDNTLYENCSGARSVSLFVSFGERVGECGDSLFTTDRQALAAEFANLATTTWRGGVAYVVPINNENTSLTFTNAAGVAEQMPIFGQVTGFITEKLQVAFPMTPNTRHQLAWASNYIAQNGERVNAQINYGSLNANVKMRLSGKGINYNLGRF